MIDHVVDGLEVKTPPIEINGTPVELAEKIFKLKGSPFSLKNRKYLYPIYNKWGKEYKTILMKFARQAEKSTTMAANSILKAIEYPYTGVIHIVPSPVQLKTYSQAHLRKMMKSSELIDNLYLDKSGAAGTDSMQEIELVNGSHFYLRQVPDEAAADKTRGIPGDILTVDELQDMYTDLIPIVEEALSHSDLGYKMMAGTAKSKEHAMYKFWEDSTQTELMVKCRACGHWNSGTLENVGKTGPICSKCGKPIYPLNPEDTELVSFNEQANVLGIRVPRLWVPWVIEDKEKWISEVIDKINRYSNKGVLNEILALETEIADRPVSKDLLMSLSYSEFMSLSLDDMLNNSERFKKVKMKFPYLFLGIDWGTGEQSYTFLTVGGVLPSGYVVVVGWVKFTGDYEDKVVYLDAIGQIMRNIGQDKLGAVFFDAAGGGEQIRYDLWHEFPEFKEILIPVRHVTQKKIVSLDVSTDEIRTDRTSILSSLFHVLNKRRKVLFPRWGTWDDLADHILHEYADYDKYGKMRYDHRPDEPDDGLHALLYMLLAMTFSDKANFDLFKESLKGG